MSPEEQEGLLLSWGHPAVDPGLPEPLDFSRAMDFAPGGGGELPPRWGPPPGESGLNTGLLVFVGLVTPLVWEEAAKYLTKEAETAPA